MLMALSVWCACWMTAETLPLLVSLYNGRPVLSTATDMQDFETMRKKKKLLQGNLIRPILHRPRTPACKQI